MEPVAGDQRAGVPGGVAQVGGGGDGAGRADGGTASTVMSAAPCLESSIRWKEAARP
ncbi:hypothetical protein [Kitasatospora sp. NPDC057198]|uniref:hypothetical protein n=1 Tax=Kitasatospora sp. NPDC057198 TaxID=3346046 RepID=UPI0036345322